MSKLFTAYLGEDEVLIQDGLEYSIKNIEKVKLTGNIELRKKSINFDRKLKS